VLGDQVFLIGIRPADRLIKSRRLVQLIPVIEGIFRRKRIGSSAKQIKVSPEYILMSGSSVGFVQGGKRVSLQTWFKRKVVRYDARCPKWISKRWSGWHRASEDIVQISCPRGSWKRRCVSKGLIQGKFYREAIITDFKQIPVD